MALLSASDLKKPRFRGDSALLSCAPPEASGELWDRLLPYWSGDSEDDMAGGSQRWGGRSLQQGGGASVAVAEGG